MFELSETAHWVFICQGIIAIQERFKAIEASPERAELSRIRHAAAAKVRAGEMETEELDNKPMLDLLRVCEAFNEKMPEETAIADVMYFGFLLLSQAPMEFLRGVPESWILGRVLVKVRDRFGPKMFPFFLEQVRIGEDDARELRALGDLDLQGAFQYMRLASADLSGRPQ